MRKIEAGKCHKCKLETPTIQIRATLLCKTCFLASVELRVRTNLSKSNLAIEAVACVGFSGGESSSFLLRQLLKEQEYKRSIGKPRFSTIHACFVDCSILFPVDLNSVKEQLSQYPSSTIVKLEDAFNSIDELHQAFSNSLSSQEDLLEICINKLLINQTKKLHAQVLILADNSTRLAIKTISYTAKGRGSDLPLKLSLNRPVDDVLVVKPCRDVLAKEIGIYNHFHQIKATSTMNLTSKKNSKSSIEKITGDFITELEAEFSSTVSTITRTAFKIPRLQSNDTCILCNGFIIINCSIIVKESESKLCYGCSIDTPKVLPIDFLKQSISEYLLD